MITKYFINTSAIQLFKLLGKCGFTLMKHYFQKSMFFFVSNISIDFNSIIITFSNWSEIIQKNPCEKWFDCVYVTMACAMEGFERNWRCLFHLLGVLTATFIIKCVISQILLTKIFFNFSSTLSIPYIYMNNFPLLEKSGSTVTVFPNGK